MSYTFDNLSRIGNDSCCIDQNTIQNAHSANYLLQNVKNINYLSKSGSALMAAVIKENYEFTKQLIEKKANLDFQDSNGQTALIMAINTNNIRRCSIPN